MPALTTPTVVGLYINNLEKLPGGNPDTDPYNYLLGTDGFGASTTWGNKIDNLINYMVSYGYNYALFYDLHKPDFIGSVPGEGAAAEAFSASGQAILESIIPRFKAVGISVAAIATGISGKATFPAELAHGFGSWAGTGESMFRVVSQVVKTTNNAATPLATGVHAGGWLTLENNRAWYFELTLIAVVTSGSAGEIGLTASWKVNGMIVNDAGTTSIHGTTYYLLETKI